MSCNGCLGQVEPNVPIVLTVAPRADHEVDGGVGEFGDRNLIGWVLEDSGFRIQHLLDGVHRHPDVIVLGDPHEEIYSSRWMMGVILDRPTVDGRVRNNYVDVVRRVHVGGEKTD